MPGAEQNVGKASSLGRSIGKVLVVPSSSAVSLQRSWLPICQQMPQAVQPQQKPSRKVYETVFRSLVGLQRTQHGVPAWDALPPCQPLAFLLGKFLLGCVPWVRGRCRRHLEHLSGKTLKMSKQDLGVGLESFLHVYLGLNYSSTHSCPRMPPPLHSSKSGLAGLHPHGDGFLDYKETVGENKEEQACRSVTNCIIMRLRNKRNIPGVTGSAAVLVMQRNPIAGQGVWTSGLQDVSFSLSQPSNLLTNSLHFS